MRHAVPFLAALVLSTAAAAQPHHGHGHGHGDAGHPMASPYAGSETRRVKALSEAQIAELLDGRGMSQALPAELNGYPGPLHVLELSRELRLSAQQRADVQALFERMQAEARAIGRMLVTAEEGLDRLFRDRTVTPESLGLATAEVARLQGRLRHAHLKYHLETDRLLDRAQVRLYGQLRGYAHAR